MEEEELDLRSDEVQEILQKVPNWTIRWGTTAILFIVVLLVFFSWFVKYPDIITGEVYITSESPPIRLVSQSNGYLEKIYFKNGSKVKKGELIALIRSSISTNDVEMVMSIVKKIESNKIDLIVIKNLSEIEKFGAIQKDINLLRSSLINLMELKNNTYINKSISSIEEQIKYEKKLATIKNKKIGLKKSQYENAEDKFRSDSILFEHKVTSKNTFYEDKSEYINSKQSLIDAQTEYYNALLLLSGLNSDLAELKINLENQKRGFMNQINSSIDNIKSFLVDWKLSFSFVAPIDGKFTILSNNSENDFVKVNQELFAITPDSSSLLAIAKFKNQAIGKLKLNQNAQIQLSNYPFEEFGHINGKISSINDLQSDDGYLISIDLKKGLNTSYGYNIDYHPEMKGVVNIITEDLRLIERFVIKVRGSINRN